MNIVVICIGILLIPRYLFPPTTSCFISKGDYDESSIVILDTTGNYYYDYNHFLDFDNDDFDEYYLFEEFNTDYDLLSEIAVLSDDIVVASREDMLVQLFVNTPNELNLGSFIKDIKAMDDTLYVLTTDSIFVLDTLLQKLASTHVVGYSDYSNLKVADNTIQFISSTSMQEHVITLNKELQQTNLISFDIDLESSQAKDFSSTHFSCAKSFALTK
ncbi:MAG: hypothetical protein HRT71_00080 [Flavobacteriales bacterium]|nr:hypothetical protein [Flavobacteriales bacterium]